jgi:hypothetical protein
VVTSEASGVGPESGEGQRTQRDDKH